MGIFLTTVVLTAAHTFTYDADVLPDRARPPWSFHEVNKCSAAVEDGVLHVRDDGTAQGELQFISYPWGAMADRPHSVEARVRVASCSGTAGVVLLAADGAREVGLTLFPDRIEAHRLGARAEVDLADGFHIVRLEMTGDDAVVKVDEKVVLDLKGTSKWDAHAGRNLVGFGSLSSADTGEAWWDYVRWSAEQPEVAVYPRAQHHVVFKQEGVYACFPSFYQYEDGTLVTTFGTRVRRSHIDNTGGSKKMVSRDGGVRWEEAGAAVPDYNPATVRADGNLAIANAVGWRYVDEGETERLKAEGRTVRDVRPGTVAYLSGARSMVRSIGGEVVRPWADIEVPPGGGMMTFHQAAYLNLRDGVRLVAIYGVGPASCRSAHVLRTEDDGDSWACLPMALGDDQMSYSETALGVNAEGHVIALMRTAESTDKERAGYLYQVTSTDRGKTWSEPVNTGIWGYPANLLPLPDGRLLATYGYRRAPMGIRACFSRDGGKSWDVDNEIVLRADGFGSGSDLGYPITQRLADGTLATIYYFNGIDNVTHICLTRWQYGTASTTTRLPMDHASSRAAHLTRTVAIAATSLLLSAGAEPADVQSPERPSGVPRSGSAEAERQERWDAIYRRNAAPWDTGRPSSELARAIRDGVVQPGRALELGCGTGTNAIYLAQQGFDVTAIDIAPTALKLAKEKADKANVAVHWVQADVLNPPKMDTFDFVFDRGCYHGVRRQNAAGYVEAVRRLSHPGAKILILAGNANETRSGGPPRVHEKEIRQDFAEGFEILSLKEIRFDTAEGTAKGALAWAILLRRK
jgi:SAM-dependent methyltransferase